MDRLAKINGQKKLLKQRLHLPLENKIETMDSLVKMHGQKNC